MEDLYVKNFNFQYQLQKGLIGAFIFLIFSLQGAVASDSPSFIKKTATIETIKQLQAGGFVLYMRHGPTDTSRPDRVP